VLKLAPLRMHSLIFISEFSALKAAIISIYALFLETLNLIAAELRTVTE
jgi:hypothetical protein